MKWFSFCTINLLLLFYVNADVKNPNELQIFGENCTLTEPLYNKTFNFTSLVSDIAHVIQINSNEKIEFNICQNLTKGCNGTSGVGACLVKKNANGNTTETILGYKQALGSYNGRIDFNYTGQKCNDNQNYQFHVVLHCDYEAEPGEINFQSFGINSCNYYLFWPTPVACLPNSSTKRGEDDCIVKDQHNHEFNLNSLNYHHHRIKYRDEIGKFFLINACKPINYGHNAMCPPDSSICLVDENSTSVDKKFFNYGTISGKPYIQDDVIYIDYKSDEKCNATHNYSSRISFPCNQAIEVDEPEFLGNINCQNFFTWQNKLTCRNHKPCTAVNAQTGDVFDLSPLSENEHKAKHDGVEYIFGVCSSTKSVCLNNAGICKNDNKSVITLGIANNKLNFNTTGSPYLIYEHGAQCGDDYGSFWQTKIEFICAPFDTSAELIKIVENTNCKMVIQYVTPLACSKQQMKCKVVNEEDGKIYDLSPLRNSKENYLANISTALNDTFLKTKDGSLAYFLNVCRPLVPQFGLSCDGGSAGCLGVVSNNSTPENELSLGFADPSVTIINKRPHLLYLRGSTCPSDPDLQLSSDIEFVCDPKAGYGKPTLNDYFECQYKFSWASNVICPQHECSFDSKTCEINNEQVDQKFDLKKIENNGIITIKHILQPLNINLCNVSELKATTNYEQSSVNIFFMINGPCDTDNGNLRVDLNIICKKSRQLNVNLNTTCSLEINLETSIICPFLGLQVEEAKENDPNTTNTVTAAPNTTSNGITSNTPKPGDDDNIESHGMSTFGVIMISLVISLMVGAAGYALRSPDRRARVMSLIRRRSLPIQYSRVQTGEEANLLIPQTGTLADSDEEMLL